MHHLHILWVDILVPDSLFDKKLEMDVCNAVSTWPRINSEANNVHDMEFSIAVRSPFCTIMDSITFEQTREEHGRAGKLMNA